MGMSKIKLTASNSQLGPTESLSGSARYTMPAASMATNAVQRGSRTCPSVLEDGIRCLRLLGRFLAHDVQVHNLTVRTFHLKHFAIESGGKFFPRAPAEKHRGASVGVARVNRSSQAHGNLPTVRIFRMLGVSRELVDRDDGRRLVPFVRALRIGEHRCHCHEAQQRHPQYLHGRSSPKIEKQV